MVSMGDVWDRTAEFLSDHLASILPIALLGIFVPAVISANLSELQQGALPGLKLALGMGSLLLAVVSFWGQLAIIALALDPGRGRGVGGVALRRLPAALLVALIVLIAGLLATIPFGVILALSGVDLSAMSTGAIPAVPAGGAAGLLVYGLLLLLLTLWLFARLAVTMPAIVGERLAVAALVRSWQLTRGVALRIVGVMILYVIVSVIASSAAQFGIGSIFRLLIGPASGISIASVLTTIIVAAVSTAFTVLGTAFTGKLFIALLAREGGRHEAVRTQ
jgi:hypothetical protein